MGSSALALHDNNANAMGWSAEGKDKLHCLHERIDRSVPVHVYVGHLEELGPPAHQPPTAQIMAPGVPAPFPPPFQVPIQQLQTVGPNYVIVSSGILAPDCSRFSL